MVHKQRLINIKLLIPIRSRIGITFFTIRFFRFSLGISCVESGWDPDRAKKNRLIDIRTYSKNFTSLARSSHLLIFSLVVFFVLFVLQLSVTKRLSDPAKKHIRHSKYITLYSQRILATYRSSRVPRIQVRLIRLWIFSTACWRSHLNSTPKICATYSSRHGE